MLKRSDSGNEQKLKTDLFLENGKNSIIIWAF